MNYKYYYVYILSNFRRTTLYLLYYESYDDPNLAIEREKQIKSWSRKKKDQLIMRFNPKLKDLYSEIV